MILNPASSVQIEKIKAEFGYMAYSISSNSVWYIGTNQVMFGTRVVVWRKRSSGPCVDYCAGNNPWFLAQLLCVINKIFEGLPEEVTEAEVESVMPRWKTRPISKDKCWEELKELALRVPKSEPCSLS